MVVFYVLCLLYVLSTASVVCDLLIIIISESELYSQVSNNPICYLKIFFLSVMQNPVSWQNFFDSAPMYIGSMWAQAILSSFCDVIAQFILVR